MASLVTRRLLLNNHRNFSLSTPALADFLINGKYSFLKDLGLNTTNPGVYNGEWKGAGQVISL